MPQMSEKNSVVEPAPVKLSRIFPAPRETVFKAWSSAEHVKRWFAPTGYTVPEAKVEMRAGGVFEFCMQAPDGTQHWTRGIVAEVSPVDRLVLDLFTEDGKGRRLFRALTEVSFTAVANGTRLDVVQTYTVFDPEMVAPMMAGAPIGWAQTLDKLDYEIAQMLGQHRRAPLADNEGIRSAVFATFHLERTYDAPLERVFKALSDETAKSKWFSGDDGDWQVIERHMDFRVGGSERVRGRWQGGVVSTFDATYHDIVPNERIVYSYAMHLDDRKISVSLATLQLKPAGARRTTLAVTEQGAFLDGYDDAGSREQGTGQLLDRLGESLRS